MVKNRFPTQLLAAMACIGASMSPAGGARAEGAANTVAVTFDNSPDFVSVGDYYSQVMFEVSDFKIPSDDNGRKQWGEALLRAFNLGEKTKSLTITAVLTRRGQSLPPIPLITYSFEGKKRLTDFKRTRHYLSPRWQLEGADPISVTLKYHYSTSQTYDPEAISDQVKSLIPSDAIVSTLGTSFISSITKLTTSIFEYSGSRAVNVTDADSFLLPYRSAVGSRGVTYTVTLPDGRPLGVIKASLVVAPSLLRPVSTVAEANPGDLRRNSEDVSQIRLDVGGVRKSLFQEIKGTPTYADVLKRPSPEAVRDYCSTALRDLANYELTRLDRTTLIYQSLLDAGFDPAQYNANANGWLADCYTSRSDRDALTVAVGVGFTPPAKPEVPVENLESWPVPVKSAMGCWITSRSGEWCKRNAPDPRRTLEAGFADEIYIGVAELPSFDVANIPPGRMFTKDQLLTKLAGAADDFACFARGFIISKDGATYNLGVTRKEGQIKSIQILRASPEDAQCLSS